MAPGAWVHGLTYSVSVAPPVCTVATTSQACFEHKHGHALVVPVFTCKQRTAGGDGGEGGDRVGRRRSASVGMTSAPTPPPLPPWSLTPQSAPQYWSLSGQMAKSWVIELLKRDFCWGGDNHKTREQMNMIRTFWRMLLKIWPGAAVALATATAVGHAWTFFTEYPKFCW